MLFIYLFFYLFLYLFIYFVCLSIYLFVCLFIYFFIYLSCENLKRKKIKTINYTKKIVFINFTLPKFYLITKSISVIETKFLKLVAKANKGRVF